MTFAYHFSVLYFVTFVIYMLFGAFGFILDRESRQNRIFLVLALTFSIWSFAFSAFTAAASYDEALFFRRISVLGWGVAFSTFLHFIMILTGSSWSQKKRLPITLFLLYLPSLFFVVFFGLYDPVARMQYDLVHTVVGWAAIPTFGWLERLYYAYVVLLSGASLYLLIRWYRTTTDANDKKKSGFLTVAYSLSITLGTFTDIIWNRFFATKLPSLTPVIILILVSTTFFVIYRYNLLVPLEKKEEKQEGMILNSALRKKFFRGIGIFLLIGSIMNYILFLTVSTNRILGMGLSFLLALSFAVIVVTPYYTDTPRKQEAVMGVIMGITLPMIMLTYLGEFTSNIIWPVPMFFIIATVIFSSRELYYGMVLLSIMTVLVFYIALPDYQILIDSKAYFLRLVFYGIAVGLSGLLRYLYRCRLADNQKQREFQNLITEITTGFVRMTAESFDLNVIKLLGQSAYFFNAGYAYVGTLSDDRLTIHVSHDWHMSGASSFKIRAISALPWCTRKLLKNEVVVVTDLHKLPSEAPAAKAFDRKSVKSLIQIPVMDRNNQLKLIIGYEQSSRNREDTRLFEKLNHAQFRMLANILGNALEKLNLEGEMNHLAYNDALTDLPNRILFANRLDQAIALATRSNHKIGVFFMDLDGFKEVNDSLGHNWGDELLKQIAGRLKTIIRKADTAARFGGDEFLLMVPQIQNRLDLNAIAEKLMTIFEIPVTVNQQDFHVTASCGIAVFPDDGVTPGALIKHADLAMYAAKKQGKGQYRFCTQKMKTDIKRRVTLTSHLHQAISRNELFLYYQPQVNSQTRKIIGYEVLLRWQHPEYGIILPGEFIPLVQQTGLISEIGEWVLMEACRQNKTWQDRGHRPGFVGVNLSIEQFRNTDFVGQVKTCLENTGLAPADLELEITERIAMEDSQMVITSLKDLKALGVRLSIDNFGSDFSSLSRLKDLPVDRIKIDMSFIQGIGRNPKDESIIAVMIHLARSLGIDIIAEGVETKKQLDFLTAEGCYFTQGYYFYKPLSRETIESEIFREDR
jgi:diguanylate cyclase (GGDEF)-like protein